MIEKLLLTFWIFMRYFAFLSFMLLTFSGYATTQVDLYHAEEVVVADKSADVAVAEKNAEEQARIQGMEAVLIRATGDKTAINNAVIQKALPQNSQYLSQIGYGQMNNQATLKMKFGAKQIRTLLTQAQLPFWPAQREVILVWFVEDQDFQRTIAWENGSDPNIQILKQEAERRGLPILVPVGDFDDITGIDASDLWGSFLQPISKASQRYHPDAVLIVRAHGQALKWSLYDQPPADLMNFSVSPLLGQASGENALEDLVDQLTQYYAKKNSVVIHGESSQSVLLKVTNLSQAISFFSLEQALKQLSSVASIDVLRIKGKDVSYRVHLLTTKKEFEQEMATIPLIERETDSETDVSHPASLPSSPTAKVSAGTSSVIPSASSSVGSPSAAPSPVLPVKPVTGGQVTDKTTMDSHVAESNTLSSVMPSQTGASGAVMEPSTSAADDVMLTYRWKQS